MRRFFRGARGNAKLMINFFLPKAHSDIHKLFLDTMAISSMAITIFCELWGSYTNIHEYLQHFVFFTSNCSFKIRGLPFISQGSKQLKVPKISRTTIKYENKLIQNEWIRLNGKEMEASKKQKEGTYIHINQSLLSTVRSPNSSTKHKNTR